MACMRPQVHRWCGQEILRELPCRRGGCGAAGGRVSSERLYRARPTSTAPLLRLSPSAHPCVLPRLRYKVHGPGAKLNFGLSEAQRAELDALTLEQLLQRYRAIGASRRGRQTRAEVQSQYRGVSWRKGKRKWQALLSFNGKSTTSASFSTSARRRWPTTGLPSRPRAGEGIWPWLSTHQHGRHAAAPCLAAASGLFSRAHT
jgi:hypothetical protein